MPLLHPERGIYGIYTFLKYFNSLLLLGFVIVGVKVAVIEGALL